VRVGMCWYVLVCVGMCCVVCSVVVCCSVLWVVLMQGPAKKFC
jgi:hypothetical protein